MSVHNHNHTIFSALYRVRYNVGFKMNTKMETKEMKLIRKADGSEAQDTFLLDESQSEELTLKRGDFLEGICIMTNNDKYNNLEWGFDGEMCAFHLMFYSNQFRYDDVMSCIGYY